MDSPSTSHEDNSSELKQFTCYECEVSYAQSWSLKWHDYAAHFKKKFQCRNCAKSFGRKDHLACHKRICTGQITEGTLLNVQNILVGIPIPQCVPGPTSRIAHLRPACSQPLWTRNLVGSNPGAQGGHRDKYLRKMKPELTPSVVQCSTPSSTWWTSLKLRMSMKTKTLQALSPPSARSLHLPHITVHHRTKARPWISWVRSLVTSPRWSTHHLGRHNLSYS